MGRPTLYCFAGFSLFLSNQCKCHFRKARAVHLCGRPRHFDGARRQQVQVGVQGGNSIGFLDRLTDRLKMGDGLKMSDFGLGMS